MQRVRDEGLHERCRILVGVGPIASAKTARWLRTQRAGRAHPRRNRRAARAGGRSARGGPAHLHRARSARIRAIPGIAGVHVMAQRQESMVPVDRRESGVLGGRAPLSPPRQRASLPCAAADVPWPLRPRRAHRRHCLRRARGPARQAVARRTCRRSGWTSRCTTRRRSSPPRCRSEIDAHRPSRAPSSSATACAATGWSA